MRTRWALLLLASLGCEEYRARLVHVVVPELGSTGGTSGASGAETDAGLGGAGGQISADAGAGAGGPAQGGTVGTDGGMDTPITCLPIPSKPWIAIAHPTSFSSGMPTDALYNPPVQAVDEDVTKRWSTGASQAGGEWIEIDFGVAVTLTRLELHHAQHDTDLTAKQDWPRGYSVSMADTTRDFGAPELAHGVGTEGFTNIVFTHPGTGRYLLIQQTNQVAVGETNWWTIHELYALCER